MQDIQPKTNENIQKIIQLIEHKEINAYEGYIYISLLVSKNSPDPRTKVGACIVDDNFKMLSHGFNDVPLGYKSYQNWNNRNYETDWINSKIPYVLHAERQAIINAFKKQIVLDKKQIFVTLFPCHECALEIIESGINRLYYYNDENEYFGESQKAAKKMFNPCGVVFEKIEIKDKYLVKKIEEEIKNG